MEAQFGIQKGIIRTRVGYAGGTTPDPSYYSISDHIESVQIDYDPAEISYKDLLNIFWEGAPTFRPISRQYTAVIYYSNEEEKLLAEESVRAHEKQLGSKTYVEVIPLTAFYLAEDYHQKYYLKETSDLYRELRAMYPDEKGLTNSTAATRINGYVAGLGNEEVFNAEVNSYGLSTEGIKQLQKIGNRLFPPGSGKTCMAVNPLG